MQGKFVKLSLFALAVLALAIVPRLSGQQLPAHVLKQMRSSAGAAVCDDTQWPPDQDIQLLKSNLRSQKKQIVAANMDLTDAEAEKFWPVYDRYASDLAKIYDTKIVLFQEYLENYDSTSRDQAESYLRPARRRGRGRDATPGQGPAGISKDANGTGSSTVLPDRMATRSHDQSPVGASTGY